MITTALRKFALQRGSSLQAQMAGGALIAVVSGLSLTGILWSSSEGAASPANQPVASESPTVPLDSIQAVASAALELGLADLQSGGSGKLEGDSNVVRGWHTRVTDFGGSLILRATAYAGDAEAIAEAYVDTEGALEVVERVYSERSH